MTEYEAKQYIADGEFEKAIETYIKIINKQKVNNEYQERADTYYKLAKLYFCVGDTENGIRCCYNVVTLNKMLYPEMRPDFINVINHTADFMTEMRVSIFVTENSQLLGAIYMLTDEAYKQKYKDGLYYSMLEYGNKKETPEIAAFRKKYNAKNISGSDIRKYEEKCFEIGEPVIEEIMLSLSNVEYSLLMKGHKENRILKNSTNQAQQKQPDLEPVVNVPIIKPTKTSTNTKSAPAVNTPPKPRNTAKPVAKKNIETRKQVPKANNKEKSSTGITEGKVVKFLAKIFVLMYLSLPILALLPDFLSLISIIILIWLFFFKKW